MNAPRPLPPCSLLDNRRDGVDVPVYNRAGKVIGYRQSLQTFRALNGEVEQARHLIVRPFRQPITPEAEANLRLLLMRAGVFSDGRPGLGMGAVGAGPSAFPTCDDPGGRLLTFGGVGGDGAAR